MDFIIGFLLAPFDFVVVRGFDWKIKNGFH